MHITKLNEQNPIIMITFGFKNKYGSVVRSIAALALGLLMVFNPENSLALVVRIFACFLIASGIISAIIGIKQKVQGTQNMMILNSVIDVALGIILYFTAGFICNFILYMIGFILLAVGIMQIIVLISATSFVGMGVFAFLLPALAAFGGGLLLFNPFPQKAMGMIAGIALVIYGASELLAAFKMRKAMEEYEIRFSKPKQEPVKDEDDVKIDTSKAIDVEFEEVDEQ